MTFTDVILLNRIWLNVRHPLWIFSGSKEFFTLNSWSDKRNVFYYSRLK